MGKSPIGNKVVLSGEIQQLSDIQIACTSITLRSRMGNNIIYLYDGSGAVQTGFLYEGESVTLDTRSAANVYVQGASGNVLFWTGVISA